MKRRLRKKLSIWNLFSVILVLTMFVSFANDFGFKSLAASGNDLTDKVTLHLTGLQVKKYDDAEGKFVYKDLVKNGERVDSTTEIYKNDDAIIVYSFKVEGPIRSGDYFTFSLPSNNILKGNGLIVPLRDKGKIIGSFSVKNDGSARVDFTVDSQNGLKSGNLGVKGYFGTQGENQSLTFTGTLPKTYVFSVKSLGDVTTVPFYPGNFSDNDVTDVFQKYGWFQKEGHFIYNITVNDVEISKIYKARIANADSIKRVKNVFIYDELPDGMIYNLNETVAGYGEPLIGVKIILYPPAYKDGKIMKDGFNNNPDILIARPFEVKKLSEKKVEYYSKTMDSLGNRKLFLTIDWSRGGESWEDFKSYIDSQTKPTVGIWKDYKMYAKLNTLPYSDLNYEDFFDEGAKGLLKDLKTLKDSGRISLEQAEMMEKAYVGQGLIGFAFDYRTFAKDYHKEKYVNTAARQVNNGDIETRKKVLEVDLGWAWGNLWGDGATNKIEVEKKWLGTPGASVDVELYDENDNNNAVISTINLIPDSNGIFKGEFAGLSKQRNNRDAKYKVRERSVKDSSNQEILNKYNTVISVEKNKLKFNILNIEKTDFKVKKKWLTHDNHALTNPPQDVEVFLFEKDGNTPLSDKDGKILSHTFRKTDYDTNGEATYSFTGLNGYRLDGSKMEYEAREIVIPEGFTSRGSWVDSDKTFVITNKMLNPANVERTINVEKFWMDENGKLIKDDTELKKLPEIVVGIYKNELLEENKVREVKLNHENQWKGTVSVPLFDGSGKVIDYKVKEITDLSSGYDVEVDGDMKQGFDIYNRRKTTDISVVKLWKDEKGEELDASSFNDVEVRLYKNDVTDPSGKKLIDKAKLGPANSWYHEFEKLPILNGLEKIIYSIEEVVVSDFNSKIHFDNSNNQFEVTNQKKSSLSGISIPSFDETFPKTPDKEDENKKDEKNKEDGEKKEEPKPSPDIKEISSSIPSMPEIIPSTESVGLLPNSNTIFEVEEIEIEIPKTPLSLPILEEEIPDLILEGDDVPLGNTSIETERNKKGNEKRELAKSGGLVVRFPFAVFCFGILILSFAGFEIIKRKVT